MSPQSRESVKSLYIHIVLNCIHSCYSRAVQSSECKFTGNRPWPLRGDNGGERKRWSHIHSGKASISQTIVYIDLSISPPVAVQTYVGVPVPPAHLTSVGGFCGFSSALRQSVASPRQTLGNFAVKSKSAEVKNKSTNLYYVTLLGDYYRSERVGQQGLYNHNYRSLPFNPLLRPKRYSTPIPGLPEHPLSRSLYYDDHGHSYVRVYPVKNDLINRQHRTKSESCVNQSQPRQNFQHKRVNNSYYTQKGADRTQHLERGRREYFPSLTGMHYFPHLPINTCNIACESQ